MKIVRRGALFVLLALLIGSFVYLLKRPAYQTDQSAAAFVISLIGLICWCGVCLKSEVGLCRITLFLVAASFAGFWVMAFFYSM
jgi:hypothetical protein